MRIHDKALDCGNIFSDGIHRKNRGKCTPVEMKISLARFISLCIYVYSICLHIYLCTRNKNKKDIVYKHKPTKCTDM